MIVAVGSDHRGFGAKKQICSIINEMGNQCLDVGTVNDDPIDYPDIAYLAATAVANKKVDRAILVCGTGIGMCIAANKIKGVRAALCNDELNAQISRHHNDANVLCISGDLTGEVVLKKIVEIWLNTDFSGGRHLRRVKKITAIEENKDPAEIKNNNHSQTTR